MIKVEEEQQWARTPRYLPWGRGGNMECCSRLRLVMDPETVSTSMFYIYVHIKQRFDASNAKKICSKHPFTFMTPSWPSSWASY